MDLNGRFELRAKFANIDAALPDEVAVSNGHVNHFHRPDERDAGVGPACMGRKENYRLVATDRALAHGMAPCRNCYEPVFEYLARQPDSPVEYREDDPSPAEVDAIDADAVADGGLQPRSDPVRPEAPLTARTEKVRIKTGASKIYHAPAANGTLCGESGDGYRSVQFEAVEGHYRPCERCFDFKE